MSPNRHSDTFRAFGHSAMPGHDDGIDHAHDWARAPIGVRRHGPQVADPSAVPTPSSAVHDDALYG